MAPCTYGPSKLLHQHQSVQCPFEMERSSSRGMHACSMALARGPLPSSSAPCDSTVPEWPPCVLSHVPACPPDHHQSRSTHAWRFNLLPAWVDLDSTLPVSLLVSSIAYSEGKKRNRAGGQRLAAWLRVGYATESAHEPAAKVSPPCRARPLNYVHVAGAEFFSRASPGNEREPAAADSQSQACDRRQLPKCQRATASS